MKVIIKYLVIISYFLIVLKLDSNPVLMPIITEFKMHAEDFSLEIRSGYFYDNSFDGWHITSRTDTVAIDSGIVLFDPDNNINRQFIVLKKDSLVSDFQINSEWDEIGLGKYEMIDSVLRFQTAETICFGNTNHSVIEYPKLYYSICLKDYFLYYFDISPTLGRENDEVGAIGYIDGLVVDSTGNPQPNFPFVYVYTNSSQNNVTSDQNGYFFIESIAARVSLHLNNKYGPFLMSQQIYPGDTTNIIINKDNLTGIDESKSNKVIQEYRLAQNYPNPFNSMTTFNYFLPISDFIEVEIFDISGKRMDNLFSGYSSKGYHEIKWNAVRYSSGVYVYRLTTSQIVLNKKCILIK